jgi:hypothetical protein
MKRLILSLALLCNLNFFTANAQLIFDNGPYFNSPASGAGGANESILYNTTLGMSTFGFGHQIVSNNSIADDFTLSSAAKIDSIVFFAYQTGSTTTSTINDVRMQIWNGPPDNGISTVIFGDLTTNRLTSSTWSGTYRVLETTLGNTDRPIMRNICKFVVPINLTAGTYWIEWQTGGTLSSGPWASMRTPLNVAASGNGKQRIAAVWMDALEGGTNSSQGFPFMIFGSLNVAQITGGLSYLTLQGAIDAATPGDEIKLLQNVSETNIVINNSIVLESNNFTLEASGLNIPTNKSLKINCCSVVIPTGFSLVNNGTLWNNGTINSSDPVSNLGTYKGVGSINGSLVNNGVLRPGN